MGPVRFLRYLAFALGIGSLCAQPGAGSLHLRYALIFSRHGVRSPTHPIEELDRQSSDPWPRWPVAPGLLTPHGHRLMVLLGAYYRDRFIAEGLLDGSEATDPSRIYVASDKVPRTIETAHALTEGLFPGTHPRFELLTSHWNDSAGSGSHRREPRLDPALAHAALEGRLGGHLDELSQAYREPMLELQRVIRSPVPWMDEPERMPTDGHWTGALSTASSLVEDLVLEYAEGMPAVGWGRLSRQQLTDIYLLHALDFDLTQGTPYLAKGRAGILARRIVRSLSQAASDRPVEGAFGSERTRLALVVGHDSEIASLAGLFRLSWVADGLPLSPTLPGGALVFELWQDAGSAGSFVRVDYIAQTLDQMRTSAPLSLARPPSVSTLFPPGGTARRDHEAPLDRFVAQSTALIGD